MIIINGTTYKDHEICEQNMFSATHAKDRKKKVLLQQIKDVDQQLATPCPLKHLIFHVMIVGF